MGFFNKNKKDEDELIVTMKTVKKTIYLKDETELISYVQEFYRKRLEWEDASNYYFEYRAMSSDLMSSDFVWNNSKYVQVNTDEGLVVVPSSSVAKITYKVVE